MNKILLPFLFLFSFACCLSAGETVHFDLTGKWRSGCSYRVDWKSASSRETRINITGAQSLHPFRKDTLEIAISGIVTVNSTNLKTCLVRDLTVWRNGIKKTYPAFINSRITVEYKDGKYEWTVEPETQMDSGADVLSGIDSPTISTDDEKEVISVLSPVFQASANDEAPHLLSCREIEFSCKGEKKTFVPVAIIGALMDRNIKADPENVCGIVEYTGDSILTGTSARMALQSLKVKAQTLHQIPGYDFKYEAVLSYPKEQTAQKHGPVRIAVNTLETVSNVVPPGGMIFSGERFEIMTQEIRSVEIVPVKE